MAAFSWRPRTTDNFGSVQVPFAEASLQAASGRKHRVALQVDSGAVVSLLRRSVADLLGLSFENGRELRLSAVGGSPTQARLHEIDTHIDGIELRVPYAIAETENVPNLLGRLGVFDRLQVDFDPTLQETNLSPQWLNPNDARIWRFLLETDRHILDKTRWSENPLPGRADEVASRLVSRSAQVFASITGLLKLGRVFGCPPLIRSLLELSMQLEFLLENPAERAQQYLDYEHVSKYRLEQAIVNASEGEIAKSIASSPDRPGGEAQLRVNYELVRDQFRKPNSKIWNNWYCKTVEDLAREVGRLADYQLWYRLCSRWSHGDPFQSDRVQMIDARQAYIASACFYGRTLLRTAEAKRIVLTSEQYEGLRELARGIV